MSLVKLTEGRILAKQSLPCPPTGPLMVGDFTNKRFVLPLTGQFTNCCFEGHESVRADQVKDPS